MSTDLHEMDGAIPTTYQPLYYLTNVSVTMYVYGLPSGLCTIRTYPYGKSGDHEVCMFTRGTDFVS